MSESITSQHRLPNKVWSQLAQEKKKTNELSSKAFFNNIKAQLSSIRTDVNKLVAPKQTSKSSSFNTSSSGLTNSSASKFNTNGYSYHGNNKSFGSSMNSSATKRQTFNLNANVSSIPPTMTQLKSKMSKQSEKQKKDLGNYEDNDEKNISQIRSSLPMESQLNQMKQLKKIEEKLEQSQKYAEEQSHKIQNFQTEMIKQAEAKEQLDDQLQSMKTILERYQKERKIKEEQLSLISCKFQKYESQKNQEVKQLSQQIFSLNNKIGQNNHQDNSLINSLNLEIKQLRDLSRQQQEKTKISENKAEEIERKKNYEIQLLRDEIRKNKTNSTSIQQKQTNFKQLGSDFQFKINNLINENYSLKNKITKIQNQLNQEKIKTQSLQETLKVYEERDSDQNYGQKAKDESIQQLQHQIYHIQQEMDKKSSDHEFEIMKLQNEIDELKVSKGGNDLNQNKSMNQILKDQITEIENLKTRLKQKNEEINRMKKL